MVNWSELHFSEVTSFKSHILTCYTTINKDKNDFKHEAYKEFTIEIEWLTLCSPALPSPLSIDLDKHKSCHCTWEPPNILTQCCASIPIKGYFFWKNIFILVKWTEEDHPFNTSAIVRRVGVKDFPNLPMEGVGVKNWKKLPTSWMDGPKGSVNYQKFSSEDNSRAVIRFSNL